MPLDPLRAFAAAVRAQLARHDLPAPPGLDDLTVDALRAAADDLRLEGDPVGDFMIAVVGAREVGGE